MANYLVCAFNPWLDSGSRKMVYADSLGQEVALVEGGAQVAGDPVGAWSLNVCPSLFRVFQYCEGVLPLWRGWSHTPPVNG